MTIEDKNLPQMHSTPPQDRPSRRTQWILVGWGWVVVLSLAWCLAILHFSVDWEELRTPRIEEGQAWTAFAVQLQIESITRLDEIPSSTGPGTRPAPGAVFLLVNIHYAYLYDPDEAELTCSADLLGDQRWWPSQFLSWSQEELLGVTRGCPAIDRNDAALTSGTMGAVFEIPASLVAEVSAVHATVMQRIPATDPEEPSAFDSSTAFLNVQITQ